MEDGAARGGLERARDQVLVTFENGRSEMVEIEDDAGLDTHWFPYDPVRVVNADP